MSSGEHPTGAHLRKVNMSPTAKKIHLFILFSGNDQQVPKRSTRKYQHQTNQKSIKKHQKNIKKGTKNEQKGSKKN